MLFRSDTHAPSPEIEHGIGWAEDDDGRLVPAVRAREVAVAFVAAGRVGVVTGSVVTPAVTGDTVSGAAATGAAAVATAAGDAVPTSASPSPVLTPMAPSTTTADPAIPTLVIRIATPRPRSNSLEPLCRGDRFDGPVVLAHYPEGMTAAGRERVP